MAQGIPLDDKDRAPWLESLHNLIATCLKDNRPGVLACSALKERYRLALLQGNQAVQVVYLKGSFEMIRARMAARTGHYMKPAMLQSQFGTLEEPQDALTVDASLPVADIVSTILKDYNRKRP